MRTLFLSALLASAAVASLAADNASVGGKWKIHNNIVGNESDVECTFTQNGNDLTGSCTSDQGTVKTTGKVDGMKVTWSYDSEYNGTPLTLNYSGTLGSAADKFSGTVSVEQFGVDGDFTATQEK
jgi:hypothetical protein